MGKQLCVAGAALLLVAADAPKSDADRLQGTWKAVRAERGGKPLPEALVKSLRIRFSGDKVFITVREDAREGVFELAPDRKPPEITIRHGSGDAKPSRGIYRFDDEQKVLWLCVAPPGKDRPTSLRPPEDQQCELWALRRVKP